MFSIERHCLPITLTRRYAQGQGLFAGRAVHRADRAHKGLAARDGRGGVGRELTNSPPNVAHVSTMASSNVAQATPGG